MEKADIKSIPYFNNQDLFWDTIQSNKELYCVVLKKLGVSNDKAWILIEEEYRTLVDNKIVGLYYSIYQACKNVELLSSEIRIESKHEGYIYSLPIWINLGYAGSEKRLKDICKVNSNEMINSILVLHAKYEVFLNELFNVIKSAENGDVIINEYIDKDNELDYIKTKEVLQYMTGYFMERYLRRLGIEVYKSRRNDILSY